MLPETRPLDNLRAVQGIIGLADKYGEKRLEAACVRAPYYGDGRYRRIRDIVKAGLDMQPLEEESQRSFRFFEFARSASDFFEEVGAC